jgi:O-glycosyl hydrolase
MSEPTAGPGTRGKVLLCVGVVIALMSFVLVPVARAASATITVSGDQRFQTIDGFGVSINAHSWKNGQLKPALDLLVDQNGSRIFRVVMEMADWEQTNDNADPNSFNWAYYNPIYSGSVFEDVWSTIDYLRAKGIPSSNIILSFMGIGPTWMGGTAVSSTEEDEWVEEVVSAAYYGRMVRGAEFGVLSPNNEEDLGHNEGIMMSTSQYARAMNKVALRLDSLGLSTLRLQGPETSSSCAGDYWQAMSAYPTLMSKIDHLAVHNYSGDACNASATIQASAYPNKSLWISEFSIYAQAQQFLEQNASALLVWDGYDSVYQHAILNGLGSAPGNDAGNAPALLAYDATTGIYTPREEFYEYSQLFKYVPSGSVRVGATSTNNGVLVLAFIDPASGRVTVVGNNTSASDQTLAVALNNLGTVPATLQYFQTNWQSNMAQGPVVTVTNGQATVTVPAGTVFTLTGVPGGGSPSSSTGPTPSSSTSTGPTTSPSPSTSPTGGATAPTSLLGSSAVGPYADSNPAGSAEAFKYLANTGGSATGLSLYVDSGSAATRVDVGIYSDLNGHPGTLLAEGSIASPQAGAWNTATLTATALTAGTSYWIGILGTGGPVAYRDQSTGSCSESFSTSGLTSLPTSWSTGPLWPTCSLSAYLTAGASTPDTSPPSSPTGLVATAVTQTGLGLGWSPSTDDVGVTGYDWYVAGTLLGHTTGTSATLTNLTCGTSYAIGVDAYDAAGNHSPVTEISATTAPCSTSTPTPVSTSAPPPVTTSSPPPAVNAVTLDMRVTGHQDSASTSLSTPPLTTTQANELLVAFVSADGPPGGPQSVSSVTGAGLTWTLQKRVNSQSGTAEIWTAAASSPLSGATVSATLANGPYSASITVAAFLNANTSATGALSGSSGPNGAPATSLSATKTGSTVWAVGNDWDQAAARTVGAGQTMVDQYLAPVNDTYWVQRLAAPTIAGQVVTMSDAAPTDDQWNLAAIEIVPAG